MEGDGAHHSKYMAQHHILADRPHRFHHGRSCKTQPASSVNDWAKTINARGQVDRMFLDFSKAFSMVPHQWLLHKLSHYGVKWKDQCLD
jgi:hypothetical protein